MFAALRTLLRRSLPASLQALGRRSWNAVAHRRVLTIWEPSGTSPPAGRALLAYIQEPFRLYPEDPGNLQFSNVGIARNWVRALNGLGYSVDVVGWSDTRFTPKGPYDLFVGHGGINFERIAGGLAAGTPTIYFATGLYWQEHNRREEERFGWLARRRGVRMAPDRQITRSEEGALRTAGGVVCLGNQSARESYRGFTPVIAINNGVYRDDRSAETEKDFAAGRANFLFFSSTGNVHKGLDLLLEAFAQTEAHLYICQEITPEFAAVYQDELRRENVHTVGRIPLRGETFYGLMDRCDFIIHPSCAEGQPGSVLDCMHQGLIPVLSRENNIDVEDFGVTLEDCSPDEIARTVRALMQYPPEACREMSRRARQATLTSYSEVGFRAGVTRAVQTLRGQAKQDENLGGDDR